MNEDFLKSALRPMVIAPHADDETLGCGGLISLYIKQGINVYILVVTDGALVQTDESNIAYIREKEALNACSFLGCSNVDFLRFPDTKTLEYKSQIYSSLEEAINKYGPDVVLCPSPLDEHIDHITTAFLVMDIVYKTKSFKTAFYEVYNPIRYNCLVNITEYIDKKLGAIGIYEHSLLKKADSFIHAARGLNAFRSFSFFSMGYYEAFFVFDAGVPNEDVLEWLTFGLCGKLSHYKFVSEIRRVDGLLADCHKCLAKNKELEEQIEMLRCSNKGKMLASLKEKINRVIKRFFN